MMTKGDRALLKRALRRLSALCGRDQGTAGECAVAPQHKEAVRLYLESWVIPLIEIALKEGRRDYGDREEINRAIRELEVLERVHS